MEYSFPASAIHSINSTRVATYTTRESEVGDNIVVVIPEGVGCDVDVVDGVLNLRGNGSSGTVTSGINLQVGFVSGGMSGDATNQMVHIKVPPYKSNLSVRNVW